MHMTNMAIGTAGLAALLHVAVTAVLPAQPPITVHRLALDGEYVVQDRTVTAKGAPVFWMQWTAAVVDPVTRLPVAGCKGSGAFNYPTGHLTARMPLADWTGAPGCTVDTLPRGVPLQLSATYQWGGEQVSAASAPFTVE